MVEPINSGELFGNASMQQGEPPRHVPVEHERCAFYVNADYDTGDDGDFECFGVMWHQHDGEVLPFTLGKLGSGSPGAWYSEDYVRQLKEAAHKVIADWDDTMDVGSSTQTGLLIEALREITK